MSETTMAELNLRSWDSISTSYQAGTRIATDDVHYGPLAPGERELCLLGDVRGKQVIEIGCGGGQNAIALAQWGATCVGIDPSSAQLAHARRLASQHGVRIQFAIGMAEDLGEFADSSFDIALSSYAFDYVDNLGQAFAETWRVLKPDGLFVFCLSHPWFQAVGWHLAGDPEAPEIGNYAAWPDVEEWDWCFEDGTSARLRGYLRTLEQIVGALIEAKFILERLIEQNQVDVASSSQQELSRFPYVHRVDPDSAEAQVMHKLPRTLLIRARKKV